MARGFKYREFSGFPVIGPGETWTTVMQRSIPEAVDESNTIHTAIRNIGLSDHSVYKKYHVLHETLRPIKVRFRDEIRPSVIVIQEFHLFVANDNSYLFADTDEQSCNEMLRRMRQTDPDFTYAHRVVDLAKMRQEANPEIRGGWFRELNIADVNVAAIFGPSVSDSDDWQRYEESGVISALTLDFIYDDTRTSVQVSRNGGIVVYHNFSEADTLELVRRLSDSMAPYAEVIANR